MTIRKKNCLSLNEVVKRLYKAIGEMDDSEGVNIVEVNAARKRAEKHYRRIERNYPEYVDRMCDIDFMEDIFDA